MRRKFMVLLLALTAAAGALGLFTPRVSEAVRCNGILVCCPETGQCRCCVRPCPIQCP
jgi:hypothetical protein